MLEISRIFYGNLRWRGRGHDLGRRKAEYRDGDASVRIGELIDIALKNGVTKWEA